MWPSCWPGRMALKPEGEPPLSAPDAPRETGLRGIIAIKAFYGMLFLVIGLGVFALINKDVSDLAEQAADSLGVDPNDRYLLLLLEWLTGVSPKQIIVVGFGTILYSGLLLTMAWGLHLRRTWAEWLTIVATGIFIPFEFYEVVIAPRFTYAAVLLINVLILWYLIRRRLRSTAVAPGLEAGRLSRDTTGSPTGRT